MTHMSLLGLNPLSFLRGREIRKLEKSWINELVKMFKVMKFFRNIVFDVRILKFQGRNLFKGERM